MPRTCIDSSVHNPLHVLFAALTLTPVVATAQIAAAQEPSLRAAAEAAPIDVTTSRPELETPAWVLELESGDGAAPCDDRNHWGRSTLP